LDGLNYETVIGDWADQENEQKNEDFEDAAEVTNKAHQAISFSFMDSHFLFGLDEQVIKFILIRAFLFLPMGHNMFIYIVKATLVTWRTKRGKQIIIELDFITP
jgi:hypothetical protein